ncbi:hypothetical protein FOL46_005598 [Perkinsus olseni]|uniref:Uncharacterized protein n=1 Tax=Perkinsus olseni TaxID=32597 RepID=A0A7J6LRH0_PEROL|nr:hypothetical protein FOL46_005598 [Perkinsus olseni]
MIDGSSMQSASGIEGCNSRFTGYAYVAIKLAAAAEKLQQRVFLRELYHLALPDPELVSELVDAVWRAICEPGLRIGLASLRSWSRTHCVRMNSVSVTRSREDRLVELLSRVTARSDLQGSMQSVLRRWREMSRRAEDDRSTFCGATDSSGDDTPTLSWKDNNRGQVAEMTWMLRAWLTIAKQRRSSARILSRILENSVRRQLLGGWARLRKHVLSPLDQAGAIRMLHAVLIELSRKALKVGWRAMCIPKRDWVARRLLLRVIGQWKSVCSDRRVAVRRMARVMSHVTGWAWRWAFMRMVSHRKSVAPGYDRLSAATLLVRAVVRVSRRLMVCALSALGQNHPGELAYDYSKCLALTATLRRPILRKVASAVRLLTRPPATRSKSSSVARNKRPTLTVEHGSKFRGVGYALCTVAVYGHLLQDQSAAAVEALSRGILVAKFHQKNGRRVSRVLRIVKSSQNATLCWCGGGPTSSGSLLPGHSSEAPLRDFVAWIHAYDDSWSLQPTDDAALGLIIVFKSRRLSICLSSLRDLLIVTTALDRFSQTKSSSLGGRLPLIISFINRRLAKQGISFNKALLTAVYTSIDEVEEMAD